MNIFLFDRKYYEKLIAHNRIDHRAAGFLDEYESILGNIKYRDLSHRKEKQRTVIQEYINTKLSLQIDKKTTLSKKFKFCLFREYTLLFLCG